MLRQKHLARHRRFLIDLLTSSGGVKALRKRIKTAGALQLRCLILLVAALVLKKVPATDRAKQAFSSSKKKRVLSTNFGSWKKVKRLSASRDIELWRHILSSIAPLLKPALAAYFENGESSD